MKNVIQNEINNNGVPLTKKEIKEIESMFDNIDNLHKEENKKKK